MRRQLTRGRGVLLLCVVGGLFAVAVAGAATKPLQLIFPVVGAVTYEDDFGAPRAQGKHEGIDILAARKAPAIAVESGKVKFWTTSAAAGCMLYLYGDSGTTYLYIHLNNDLGSGNDNRGKCVAGTAYAPGLKNGAKVQAGQQIAFVGDSGDANGIHPHLHFELHPNDGKAVDPYSALQAALPLLFAAKAGTPFSLTLTGTVVSATEDRLKLQVRQLQSFPSAASQKMQRTLTVSVPATALVEPPPGPATTAPRLLAAYAGQPVVVWTQPALSTLKAQRGDDLALVAALVQLG